MAEITPLFQFDFQRNLNLRFSNAWARTMAGQWWKSVAITNPSSALEEIYEWMLETAQIRSTGSKGKELDFEDLVAISHSITNENFGTGLKIDRNSFEDNRYDRAAKWAADVGEAAGYWPQRKIVELIQAGTTKKGYDGVNFFSSSHPVNPYDDTLGTYANLFTGKPLTAANVASVVASILAIKHPGDAPRYLKPRLLLVDPSNQLTAQTVTDAELISDPVSGATNPAAVTNIIKRKYAFGEPIVVPEFANEAGVWYVGCEANEDALQGAFIYQERKPFELTSYTGMTQAELDRINEFEWHLRGRNTTAYGHPYLFFRVEPT
jgi:phage major head subunit gpT-like protein